MDALTEIKEILQGILEKTFPHEEDAANHGVQVEMPIMIRKRIRSLLPLIEDESRSKELFAALRHLSTTLEYHGQLTSALMKQAKPADSFDPKTFCCQDDMHRCMEQAKSRLEMALCDARYIKCMTD